MGETGETGDVMDTNGSLDFLTKWCEESQQFFTTQLQVQISHSFALVLCVLCAFVNQDRDAGKRTVEDILESMCGNGRCPSNVKNLVNSNQSLLMLTFMKPVFF